MVGVKGPPALRLMLDLRTITVVSMLASQCHQPAVLWSVLAYYPPVLWLTLTY